MSLSWSSEAKAAFNTLKEAFCSAPLLIHPDPNCPFIADVDVSTTDVRAVLSQQQGRPPKLHPCTYFLFLISERNYDIRNSELLAIKLAQEKWRHWLEGA